MFNYVQDKMKVEETWNIHVSFYWDYFNFHLSSYKINLWFFMGMKLGVLLRGMNVDSRCLGIKYWGGYKRDEAIEGRKVFI